MPRREILSPAQREALLAIPVDRAGLIEHYVLSEQDISLIRQRRGDHNRLGIAVQLALLRFPGTALQADETPPKELINFLARQLHVPSSTQLRRYAPTLLGLRKANGLALEGPFCGALRTFVGLTHREDNPSTPPIRVLTTRFASAALAAP